MGSYWDSFVSEFKNSILFDWNVKETLEQYTRWLAEQPGVEGYFVMLRESAQRDRADANYEGP